MNQWKKKNHLYFAIVIPQGWLVIYDPISASKAFDKVFFFSKRQILERKRWKIKHLSPFCLECHWYTPWLSLYWFRVSLMSSIDYRFFVVVNDFLKGHMLLYYMLSLILLFISTRFWGRFWFEFYNFFFVYLFGIN